MARIFVTVKTKARTESVEKIDESHFKVAVTEPPIEGKANYAVIKALAKHLGVPQIKLEIVSGKTSRQKVVDIML